MPSFADCSLDTSIGCKSSKKNGQITHTAICIKSVDKKSAKKSYYETKCVENEKVTTYRRGNSISKSGRKTMEDCGCCDRDTLSPIDGVLKIKNEDADYCPAPVVVTTTTKNNIMDHSTCGGSGQSVCGTKKDGTPKYPVCFRNTDKGYDVSKCITLDYDIKSHYDFQHCGYCTTDE